MEIKEITSQYRNDFTAIMFCEHCGHEQENKYGYDDDNYYQNVIPAMRCEKCKKNQAGDTPYADAPAATSPPAGESQPRVCHAINRTSPMGGQFIGQCSLCGATGLKSSDALKPCPNPRGVSSDDALLAAINGSPTPAPASPAEAGGVERTLIPDTAAIERAVNTMIHARECFGVVTRLGRCAEGGEQIGNREHCEQMLGELKSATIGLRASLRGGNKLAEHEKAERAGGR